jgi:FkbM family methyltransferase
MMEEKLDLEAYEKMQPAMRLDVDGASVTYATPNLATAWRVKSFFSKEPETIAWIGEMAPDEVLVDIGANVGMYSIWAAKVRGTQVFAFEPESQNYALLNRNIFYNALSGRVVAFCTALSDETGFDRLHLAVFEMGQSCHTFGESLDHHLKERHTGLTQGAFATTLDALVADGSVPPPHHIKIDVDGLEHKVIAGAAKTIADPTLKSILVEINQNLAQHMAVVQTLKDAGFDYSLAQVAESERLEGPFKGVANYVFRR